MTATTPADTVTCAKPSCGNPAPSDESVYIDGCGQVCPDCASPQPDWINDIEPPY
jgi:hypothetical protein